MFELSQSTVREKVEVWMRREATFYYQDQPNLQWPQDYAHVATLTDVALEDAFKRSNNIDSSWIEADGVEVNEEGCARYCFDPADADRRKGMRSSSVGDIFRCAGSGAKYEVTGSGFKRVFAEAAWNKLGETFRIPAGEPFAMRDNPRFFTKVEDTEGDTSKWILTAFDDYTGKTCEVNWLDFCDLVDAGLLRCHRWFSEGITPMNRKGTHGTLLATEYSFGGRDHARHLFSQGA